MVRVYHKGQYWGLYYLTLMLMIYIVSQVNSNVLQFTDDLKMFQVIHDAADFY